MYSVILPSTAANYRKQVICRLSHLFLSREPSGTFDVSKADSLR